MDITKSIPKFDHVLSNEEFDTMLKSIYNCKSEEEVNNLANLLANEIVEAVCNSKSDQKVNTSTIEKITDKVTFFVRLFFSFGVDNLEDFLFLISLVTADWNNEHSPQAIHCFWGIKATRESVCKSRKISTSTYYKKLNNLIEKGIITKHKGTWTYIVNHRLYWNQYGEIGSMWYLHTRAMQLFPDGRVYDEDSNTKTVRIKCKKENKKYLVYYDKNNNVLYKDITKIR